MTDPAPPITPPGMVGAGLRDWVSLTKPGITALICLVAVGGFLIADPSTVRLLPLLLVVGTGALASAGSAMLNHFLERERDRGMKRTRTRPLAAQRLGSGAAAAAVGLGLVALGVGAATLLLNPLTGLSILLGAFTYVVVYTAWLKPRSSWNIVIGGFAGSAPALAGGAAAVGGWTPGVLALALLVFLWTPPHFWSLALLLKDDYQRAGLPMLPRMDDVAFSGRVVVVSAALLVPATVLVAIWGLVTLPVAVAMIALGVGFVVVTAPLWTEVTRARARRGFLYSGPYLLGIVAALVVNALLVHAGFATGL
ncbi:MAG TPA: heme o synthase [Thermoplasmata archaeon]|nr:heme o synthase [Thermoplasmata archaeon]